jgi:L,D-peptidoglycan transpeptidase YkuD (ErfK/YbiS/YcfS/YnhG family)
MVKNWVVTKVNKNFFLRVGKKIFKCQIGKAGYKIYSKKQEGDKGNTHW